MQIEIENFDEEGKRKVEVEREEPEAESVTLQEVQLKVAGEGEGERDCEVSRSESKFEELRVEEWPTASVEQDQEQVKEASPLQEEENVAVSAT